MSGTWEDMRLHPRCCKPRANNVRPYTHLRKNRTNPRSCRVRRPRRTAVPPTHRRSPNAPPFPQRTVAPTHAPSLLPTHRRLTQSYRNLNPYPIPLCGGVPEGRGGKATQLSPSKVRTTNYSKPRANNVRPYNHLPKMQQPLRSVRNNPALCCVSSYDYLVRAAQGKLSSLERLDKRRCLLKP